MIDPASLTFAKVGQAIGIRGAIAIVLAIALGIVMWRADSISEDREDLRNDLAGEKSRHEISRNSIETLEAALAKFVGAGQASRIAQVEAIEAQAKDSAELQAQADRIRSEMETLAEGDPCDCSTPGSILDAEGL